MSNNITRNDTEHRYEIRVDGILAGVALVQENEDSVTFTHTEVYEQFDGQGLAGELVSSALDDVRVRGKKVVALCPYVARFVKKHPDYADLLA